MQHADRLAIFDIDGTLTDTNVVDDECFLQAAAEVFGLDAARLDWSGTPHVTDAAIARWLCEAHCGRAPGEAELERVIDRFVELLAAEVVRAPERFAPVAGAVGLLPALRAAGWEVALATGGWRPSARLKLRVSGLDEPELVLACASDALTREEIIRLAHDRAAARGPHAYVRVVSVGDGVWDVRSAAALGLPFVGVGHGPRADALRDAGAMVILPDLRDRTEVCKALATAPVPVPRDPRRSGHLVAFPC